ncbi:GNAT family N-acetyltransferase [Oryzibacter oryziterrae]|uniref:GNAT family N-acetyltransferase n=1 Tax=Oryzibacter oryziterrae TaxID=2766474 RepID=UPI001F022633|nr:GNAT family N-acetyltransferase [Oryzibacter oryziterrae]
MSPTPPIVERLPVVGNLVLRAASPDDAAAITRISNLPGYLAGTLRQPFQPVERTRSRLENLPPDNLHVVAELDGTIVGNAVLDRHGGRRRHVASIGMGVDDAYVGRGIGTALLAALIEAADNWLDIVRLELTVYPDNQPALSLYKRFGFEHEGLHRADTYRNGRYVDALSMARLRPDWVKSTSSHP